MIPSQTKSRNVRRKALSFQVVVVVGAATATFLSSSHALLTPIVSQIAFRRQYAPIRTWSVSDPIITTTDDVSTVTMDATTTISSNVTAHNLELTHKIISTLPFRQLKSQVHTRGLPDDGTTAQLRQRLRAAIFPDDECVIRQNDADFDEEEDEDCGPNIAKVSHA